ncbi:MAG: Rieske (2Fe-2S) protein [Actinobacteria bacterium]|nr:Rieske (2Fe-2S) protein [Actinomycetota bacterium]
MPISIQPTRRTVLVGSAAGAAGLALAACTSSGSSSNSASGRTSASASNPASNAASGDGGTTLAALDSVNVGEAISVKLPNGKPGIVARPTDSTAVAFSAICTHMGCTVAPAGKELHCPCHGSRYNATTGAVIQGPAPRALAAVPVHIADGQVVTGAS